MPLYTSTWNAKSIPDLTGKVALVTGGNVGIGYETCYFLASHGAIVYLAARTESKALEAIKNLNARLAANKIENAKIHYHHLDLSSIKGAAESAKAFLPKESKLDILIANAGMMGQRWTEEYKYEPQLYVNHLSQSTFVKILLPLVEAAAAKTGDARIVVVSSHAHLLADKGIDYDAIRPGNASDMKRGLTDFSGIMKIYGQSKLANVWFAKELDRRLKEEKGEDRGGIYVNIAHPGWVGNTGLGFAQMQDLGAVGVLMGPLVATAAKLFALNHPDGAATQTFLATSPEVAEHKLHGGYFVPRKSWTASFIGSQEFQVSPHHAREEDWKKLWDWTDEVVKQELGETI